MVKVGDKVKLVGYTTPCVVVAVEDFHGFDTVVLRSLDGRKATRARPVDVESA